MLNRLNSALKVLFKTPNRFKMQTFTYFIPSPPARSTGYREKHFDKLFFEFINKGYEIKSISTQASTGDKHSGMWIICLVQATCEEAEILNLDELINDQLKGQAIKSSEIDGLYYIDDQVNK